MPVPRIPSRDPVGLARSDWTAPTLPGDSRRMNRYFPAAALLLLAACSASDEQPGGLTADEAKQLDDAAAMLDANAVDLNALDANATDPEG